MSNSPAISPKVVLQNNTSPNLPTEKKIFNIAPKFGLHCLDSDSLFKKIGVIILGVLAWFSFVYPAYLVGNAIYTWANKQPEKIESKEQSQQALNDSSPKIKQVQEKVEVITPIATAVHPLSNKDKRTVTEALKKVHDFDLRIKLLRDVEKELIKAKKENTTPFAINADFIKLLNAYQEIEGIKVIKDEIESSQTLATHHNDFVEVVISELSDEIQEKINEALNKANQENTPPNFLLTQLPIPLDVLDAYQYLLKAEKIFIGLQKMNNEKFDRNYFENNIKVRAVLARKQDRVNQKNQSGWKKVRNLFFGAEPSQPKPTLRAQDARIIQLEKRLAEKTKIEEVLIPNAREKLAVLDQRRAALLARMTQNNQVQNQVILIELHALELERGAQNAKISKLMEEATHLSKLPPEPSSHSISVTSVAQQSPHPFTKVLPGVGTSLLLSAGLASAIFYSIPVAVTAVAIAGIRSYNSWQNQIPTAPPLPSQFQADAHLPAPTGGIRRQPRMLMAPAGVSDGALQARRALLDEIEARRRD